MKITESRNVDRRGVKQHRNPGQNILLWSGHYFSTSVSFRIYSFQLQIDLIFPPQQNAINQWNADTQIGRRPRERVFNNANKTRGLSIRRFLSSFIKERGILYFKHPAFLKNTKWPLHVVLTNCPNWIRLRAAIRPFLDHSRATTACAYSGKRKMLKQNRYRSLSRNKSDLRPGTLNIFWLWFLVMFLPS